MAPITPPPMKTVVVTGANRGLGLELTRVYIDDMLKVGDDRWAPRWRVVAVARQHTDVIHGHDRERTRGIDVSKPDASNALGIVLAKYAPVDVLINNAAVCIGRECAVGNVDYAPGRARSRRTSWARCGSWKRRSRTSPATPSS